MKILAVDTSAKAASAAVTEGGKILSENFTDTGLTHSQTLMPMVKSVLDAANISVKDIDIFAINNGPGSFTGVRIGVAAVKGMAQPLGKECVAVSTLEALAYNLIGLGCVAVSAMDARCGQVYTASFECGETVERLCGDEAVEISGLEERLKSYRRPIIFVGDGASLCYDFYKDKVPCSFANELLRYQRASSTALAAQMKAMRGETVPAEKLMPFYLRLPQAERELKKKKGDII
ncbi:MAG: tRNA (adenosine(37)-N6)-threonylcarbamoyltransferase complex dimerization subunit type 1 TsaB [Acutalibacteraceae bacterium]|nr:tRNA (adenosine(37)-N6)-threonylcarbamoyltransferase complex dimerization subunit type 1 TsaB [Oscillospiraceae bacterium]